MSVILQPTHPVEVETRKQVLVSQSGTGARRAVRKSRAFRFYTLEFHGRKQSEYSALEPVWAANYPKSTIEWVNSVLDASGQFYFDSPLKWSPTLNNLFDYAFSLKRRDAQALVAQESNVLPFGPSYGYEVNPDKETSVSDSVSYARAAEAVSSERRLISLVFRARSLAETLLMEQFWDYYYPCSKIAFTEPVLGVDGEFWIDSNFKWRVLANHLTEYSFAVREV